MMVPFYEHDEYARLSPASNDPLLSGGVSSGWMELPEKPQRRIGFRMPKPPPDPSWMLLP